MLNMGELLVNAGFEVESNIVEDYVKPSQVEFPFGSLTSDADSEINQSGVRESLRGINYIRRNMQSIVSEEFKKEFPMKVPNFLYNYLLKNIDRVRVVDKGSIKRSFNCRPGYHSADVEFVKDLPYGFADVIAMFHYSMQTNRVLFTFDSCRINRHYQTNLLSELFSLTGEGYLSVTRYEECSKYFKLLRPMLDRCPYLLISKSEYDGVRISHKKYTDSLGRKHDEVTSPCLGVNILNDEYMMSCLKSWLSEGGKINPNNFYLIHENRDTKELYLARWKQSEIPNEYCLLGL